jgi:hypothetical protein
MVACGVSPGAGWPCPRWPAPAVVPVVRAGGRDPEGGYAGDGPAHRRCHAMKPMPPGLRRVSRPAMTRLVVAFLLNVVGFGCYLYAIYAHYGVGGHAPDDPPSVTIVISAVIAIHAGIVASASRRGS